MFSVTPQKSDRVQTFTAVFFMGLFAFTLVIAVMLRDNIKGFACSYLRENDRQSGICSSGIPSPPPSSSHIFIVSKITAACVDPQGLKISVAFGEPLTGEARIQIFSTGPDFFPSEQGMKDTYELDTSIAEEVDHLDFIVPVSSMPVGEQIFGNIVVSDEEGIFSNVAYLINVYDCSVTKAPLLDQTRNPAFDNLPVIHSATCLPDRQLMIAFEIENPVPGQYQALVAGFPYQLTAVVSQPTMLFFSGDFPQARSIVIKLVSTTEQDVLLEEIYTPPVCNIN